MNNDIYEVAYESDNCIEYVKYIGTYRYVLNIIEKMLSTYPDLILGYIVSVNGNKVALA